MLLVTVVLWALKASITLWGGVGFLITTWKSGHASAPISKVGPQKNGAPTEALMASFSVRDPVPTGITSAPSRRMRATLSACRSVSTSPMYTTQSRSSSAQAVAVATPC